MTVTTANFMAALDQYERDQRTKDIASGRLVSAEQIRERLGLSEAALTAALEAKRMFAMKGPSGDDFYPAFFAEVAEHGRGTVEQVCEELGDLPAGSKWDFFTVPRQSLGGKSALDALAKGQAHAVLDAARAFREE